MWDMYKYLVYEEYYFQRHYVPAIEEYMTIKHADEQRFTHFGSSSLHEHIQ